VAEKRRDVHDHSAARFEHRARRGLRAEERRAEVDVDDALPDLARERLGLAQLTGSGVVHEHVQPAELVQDALDERLGSALRGQLGADAQRALDVGGGRLRALLRARRDRHAHPAIRELGRDRAADAGGRAGDDRYLSDAQGSSSKTSMTE
jgi:hypothetical protein